MYSQDKGDLLLFGLSLLFSILSLYILGTNDFNFIRRFFSVLEFNLCGLKTNDFLKIFCNLVGYWYRCDAEYNVYTKLYGMDS